MNDIHPIKSIVGIEYNGFVIVLLTALILSILIFYLFKKFSKPQPQLITTPTPVTINYRDLALQQLNEAKQLGLIGKDKQYALKLTHVLKTYLSKVLNQDFTEATTAQISKHFSSNSQQEMSLNKCLDQLDLIKFAKKPLTKTDVNKLHALATKIIQDF